jgi:DNA-binding winged helix-turn-helix (wHTH) protein
MKLSKEMENKIIEACGGYLWLISHIQRYIRDNPSCSFEETYKDESLMIKLESIFSKFTAFEQELMLKAYDNLITDMDRQTHEYKYLLEIKMLKEKNKKTSLGIPLLSLIVEKEKSLRKIELKDDKIFVSGHEIDGFLTKNEKKLLTLLLSHQKKIVLRDTLARNLWGERWEDKYSDWAIDRLVYRLRKKMKQTGLNEKLLKTVKRKGFIFG